MVTAGVIAYLLAAVALNRRVRWLSHLLTIASLALVIAGVNRL